MHIAKLAASLLVLLALALGAASAQAETVNCTPVTSLPAVITVQGIYCFTGDRVLLAPRISCPRCNQVLSFNASPISPRCTLSR